MTAANTISAIEAKFNAVATVRSNCTTIVVRNLETGGCLFVDVGEERVTVVYSIGGRDRAICRTSDLDEVFAAVEKFDVQEWSCRLSGRLPIKAGTRMTVDWLAA